MQYDLLISPIAFKEANAAYNYYEKKQIGLGERFIKSLKESYYKLSLNPQYYSYIKSKTDVRDIKIKDFPFLVIYQIIEDRVLVLRVFNTNRKPQF